MRTRFLIVAVFLLTLAGPLAAQPVEGPNGNYYELVSAGLTWDEAKTAAESMTFGGAPGYLATLTSAEEDAFVASFAAASDAWFGASDLATDGNWEWVTGEVWSYTNWNNGEPNGGTGENCAHYFVGTTWNDTICSTIRNYVVEYDAVAFVPQSNTFPTADIVAGGGDAGTPDITITCNAGLPLSQTAPVGTTFTVTQLSAGDVCTVALASDVDDGYEATGYSCPNGTVLADMAGCEYTMGVASAAWPTTVQVAASPVEFSVDVDWDISEDADPGIGAGATVEMVCSGQNFTSTTLPAGPMVTMPVTLTGVIPPAKCYAELTNVGSAVDADSCGDTVLVGEGDAACDITATAFYEGIPTLSQYGLAIMVLLMLGVGFVGFRRFI